MSKKKYGREFFEKHFDYIVQCMQNRVPIREIADTLNIGHITLANMCHRYGLSANQARYNHAKTVIEHQGEK